MVSNRWVALVLTLLLSGAALFVFLISAYHRLPNARLSWREVLPGALLVSVSMAATIQLLPLFVFLTSEIVALQVLGTTFLLLVTLYVLAIMIVFGATLNYVLAYGVTGRAVQEKHPASTPAPS